MLLQEFEPYGASWRHLGLPGAVWGYLVLKRIASEAIWKYLRQHDATWSFLTPYGATWRQNVAPGKLELSGAV